MNLKIKFLPIITLKNTIPFAIIYAVFFIAIFYFYKQYGIIAIILFSLLYAFMLLGIFFALSKKYYIELDEDKMLVKIYWLKKKTVIDVQKFNDLEMYQTKNSYILSFNAGEKNFKVALSGPLDFEEPQFLPFLRKLDSLNPEVRMGAFLLEVMHGSATFKAWSNKMYFLYWIYISIAVFSYVILLGAIFVLK